MSAPVLLAAALSLAAPGDEALANVDTAPANGDNAPANGDTAPAPGRVALAEPSVPSREPLRATPRRRYYGAPQRRFIPGLILGVGLGARLAGAPADRAHFALDALAYARAGLHRGRIQAGLFPALGYSLGAGKVTREHLLVAGLGLGMIDPSGAVAVIPALVFGTAERARVLGVRTALVLDGIKPGFFLEVAHQMLVLPTGARHELRLLVALDLITVIRGGRR